MSQLQKTSKRIVSKGEYAAQVARKAVLTTFGLTLFLLSFVFLLGTYFLVPKALSALNNPLLALYIGVLLIGAAFHVYLIGQNTMTKVKAMEAGVPFTRSNTSDLPAHDSLVRASQEPVQAQEAILLRAAMEGVGKHEEQLLREAPGGQE